MGWGGTQAPSTHLNTHLAAKGWDGGTQLPRKHRIGGGAHNTHTNDKDHRHSLFLHMHRVFKLLIARN